MNMVVMLELAEVRFVVVHVVEENVREGTTYPPHGCQFLYAFLNRSKYVTVTCN